MRRSVGRLLALCLLRHLGGVVRHLLASLEHLEWLISWLFLVHDLDPKVLERSELLLSVEWDLIEFTDPAHTDRYASLFGARKVLRKERNARFLGFHGAVFQLFGR